MNKSEFDVTTTLSVETKQELECRKIWKTNFCAKHRHIMLLRFIYFFMECILWLPQWNFKDCLIDKHVKILSDTEAGIMILKKMATRKIPRITQM